MGKKIPRDQLAPEELERIRKMNRRHAKMQRMGKPATVTPEEFARARRKLLYLHDTCGLSDRQIAAAMGTGTHGTSIRGIRLEISQHGAPTRSMRRSTYNAVMNTKFTVAFPDDRCTGARISPLKTQRMLRALIAEGFTGPFLAGELGYQRTTFWLLAGAKSKRTGCRRSTQDAVELLYGKLAGTRPEDYGITFPAAQRARALARRHQWAPSHCWDDDTIGVAGAIPEWTGRCGSASGYYLHLKYDIQVRNAGGDARSRKREVLCQPCKTARTAAVGTDPESVNAAMKEAGYSRRAGSCTGR